MNQGDTGSFLVHASRDSGESWTEDSRMLFTVTNQAGDVVIKRIYRLDDQYDLGDGWVLVEFHNEDTDELPPGSYNMERRYNITPIWRGTPPTGRCVDALETDAEMINGDVVRTVFRGTLTIEDILGRI